jgi:hypothetical protein
MDKQQTSRKSKNAAREDRLKAALKSNMARRKAQSKARAASERDDEQHSDKE